MNEIVEYQNYSEFSRKILLPGATSEEVVSILEFSYEYITTLRQEIIQKYWIDTYDYVLRESIWRSKSLLSFDDFFDFISVRNNLHCYFMENSLGDIYRTQSLYKKFVSENPELDKKLKIIFNEKNRNQRKTRSEIRLLYRVYTIMFSYGEIRTNHDLFV